MRNEAAGRFSSKKVTAFKGAIASFLRNFSSNQLSLLPWGGLYMAMARWWEKIHIIKTREKPSLPSSDGRARTAPR